MMIADIVALVLVIVGAVNWGSIGLFGIDLVATLFGGQMALMSRIIYSLVGLAGIWCITLLFKERGVISDDKPLASSRQNAESVGFLFSVIMAGGASPSSTFLYVSAVGNAFMHSVCAATVGNDLRVVPLVMPGGSVPMRHRKKCPSGSFSYDRRGRPACRSVVCACAQRADAP